MNKERLLWGALYLLLLALALFDVLQTALVASETNQIIRWIFVRALAGVYLIAFLSFWKQAHGLIGSKGILPVEKTLEQLQTYYHLPTLWSKFCTLPTLFWLRASDASLTAVCAAGSCFSTACLLGVWPFAMTLLMFVTYLSLQKVGRDFMALQFDALLLEAGFLSIFLARPLHFLDFPASLFTSVPASSHWSGLDIFVTTIGGCYGNSLRSALSFWLLRWLVVRLMFSSGVVKLTSGDITWKNCTALCYHYFTQPLPTPLSWYFHHLPHFFHRFSCVVHFFIEIVAALLGLLPSRLAAAAAAAAATRTGWSHFGWLRLTDFKLLSAFALAALQVLILLTGNYGFFNILSITLCLPLLNDALVLRAVSLAFSVDVAAYPDLLRQPSPHPAELAWLVPAVCLLVVSFRPLMDISKGGLAIPGPLKAYTAWLWDPLQRIGVLNRYGLFANMTTSRAELIFLGSDDRVRWLPYSFKYKPDLNVSRPPQFIPGHLPRMDWRLWFCQFRRAEWVVHLLHRMLTGSEDVLRLFAHNPFADKPPRFIRADMYDFRFTDRPWPPPATPAPPTPLFLSAEEELLATVPPPSAPAADASSSSRSPPPSFGTHPAPSRKDWWRARFQRLYCPVCTLRGDEVVFLPEGTSSIISQRVKGSKA